MSSKAQKDRSSSAPTESPDSSALNDEIIKLAGKCNDTATELCGLINTLKASSRRHIPAKLIKGYRKRDEIQEIQKRLDGHQKVLSTRILTRLHIVSSLQLQGLDAR